MMLNYFISCELYNVSSPYLKTIFNLYWQTKRTMISMYQVELSIESVLILFIYFKR